MNTSVHNQEFISNNLALDFVNSIEYRDTTGRPVNDFFIAAEAVLVWAERAKIITTKDKKIFQDLIDTHPKMSSSFLQRAKQSRELLYRLFCSAIDGKKVNPRDLQEFQEYLNDFRCYKIFSQTDHKFDFVWRYEDKDLDIILAKVTFAAMELLCNGDFERLRRCPASDCGWLFFDISKNGMRRWCDMEDCGNRAKARRFFASHREA